MFFTALTLSLPDGETLRVPSPFPVRTQYVQQCTYCGPDDV